MASFNSSTFNSTNKWVKFRMRVTEISQNPVTSVSRVKVQIQAWRTDNNSVNGGGTANLYVGANTYTASIPSGRTVSYYSYTTLAEWTINVNRGTTGNAATNMYCRLSGVVNSDGTEGYTFHLTPISRYAVFDSVTDFDDEHDPTVTYINPSGTDLVTGLEARITWSGGSTSWVTLNDEGGSVTFDLSAYRSAMDAATPNSNTLAVNYELKSTMSGDEYTDTRAATMYVVNADPTPGALTYQDTNAATVAKTGDASVIVQGQSDLTIHTDAATPEKGASIQGYTLNFNGSNYTPDANGDVTISAPNYAGEYTADLYIVDSRSNVNHAEITIKIWELTAPTAVYSLERVNNFETDTVLNVDGKISDLDGTNMLTIKEKHRIPGGAWSAEQTVADATDTHLSLNNIYEWEVLVTVSDEYSSTTYTLTVGKGIPIAYFDAKRHSFGVNGFPDADEQLYVGGTIKADGVVLPHAYSTTEQKIGKWIDGSDLYESVIELNSTVTLAANANTSITSWGEPINIVYFNALRISGSITTAISYVGGFYNNGNVYGVNPRATTQGVDVLIMRYTK